MAVGAGSELRSARRWAAERARARRRLGRPWPVLVASGLLVVAALAIVLVDWGSLGPFSSRDPGSGSERARQRLAKATGVDPDFGLLALVRLPAGDLGIHSDARVARVAAVVRGDPGVARVVPASLRPGDPLTASDRRAALIVGQLRAGPIAQQLAAARRLRDRLAGDPGVWLGGKAAFYANGNDLAAADLRRTDLIALVALIVPVMVVFGSPVAAGFVVLTAGAAVALTLATLTLAGHLLEISAYARNVVGGLGLGLGVDYSLLLVSRVREEAARDGYGRPAVDRALASAGATIKVSALIVAGAGLSLQAFPQPLLRSIGLAIVLVAGCACLAALVALPALVVILGERLDHGTMPHRRARPAPPEAADPTGRWYAHARRVQARPRRYALITGATMLAIAAPALTARLTQIDANVVPAGSPDRRVAQTIQRDFPTPSAFTPVYTAVRAPSTPAGRRAVQAYAAALGRLPGAARATAPQQVAPGLWRVDLQAAGGPLTAGAERLVRAIRTTRAPGPAVVGGETAQLVDLRAALAARWPWALLILLAMTLGPLAFATRSAWLPVKTFAMNALTLAAAFGLLVAIFQDGRLEGLLDYTSSGALEAATMTVVAAIAFALATDYGVFLLTRVKEFRDLGLEQSEAIARGLQRTGPIITQAALLLCIALLSLLFARHALVKQVGLWTAVAVALDASLVRAFLVPSLMALFGPAWNWWWPRRPHR